MSLIDVTNQLRTRLPKLSPFYGKTITKNVTYDGTNMVINGGGIVGSEISFADVIVRCNVIASQLLNHNGIAVLELEFDGFLPIVFDAKEQRLSEVELFDRTTNEIFTFPIYDINNQTNKMYLRWSYVPNNALNLSYQGTNHYVNGVYKEGVSFTRVGSNIVIPTDFFSNYTFAQARINTELYISLFARDQIEDNRSIQTQAKPSSEKRCVVYVIPSIERFAPNPNNTVSGVAYLNSGEAMDIRYVIYFSVILAVYGAWDNMSKGAMYKFLEDRKREVNSILMGYVPTDEFSDNRETSACVLESARYGNLDNIKGILSCELRYEYTYRDTSNIHVPEMSEYYNINKIALFTKSDINEDSLVADILADEQEQFLLNENGGYVFSEDSTVETANGIPYKEYLDNLPSF